MRQHAHLLFIRSVCFCLLLLALSNQVMSQTDSTLTKICPANSFQQRTPRFDPGGIILTTFDKAAIWVYDIDQDRRYPLPDTYPCGSNCRLSPDARWITYLDDENQTYAMMRLDGTERTPLINYAADVEWWSSDTLLVWTPGHEVYLQPLDGGEPTTLESRGVISVQPGGQWGLLLQQENEQLTRTLVNLETRNLPGIAEVRISLSPDIPYFNAARWSPDGTWLAYVGAGPFDTSVNREGGELFGIQPGEQVPTQWTDLSGNYGAVRINGYASSALSWSPDSSLIAFWVIELLGANPENNTGSAVIHMLDATSGETRVYCGFSTGEHTPNPPRLVWSPDSTHLAFGGNIPGDDKGYLLLALDVDTGVFTELSDGIFPALGNPDVIAWGLPPL